MAQPCMKEGEIQQIRDWTVEYRTDMKYVKESLNKILNNHLAHIQSDISSINKTIGETKKANDDRFEKNEADIQDIKNTNFREKVVIGLISSAITVIIGYIAQFIIKEIK